MLRRIREAKKDQSGFTLIELLIVIVILGILAAIVVFAVSAFNKNGQQAACKSDFKSVQVADEAYFAKTGAYAATLDQLVPTYLKELPSTNNNYVISLGANGPLVAVNGGVATPNYNDPATGCGALS
jgi:general secretion pathway protein G